MQLFRVSSSNSAPPHALTIFLSLPDSLCGKEINAQVLRVLGANLLNPRLWHGALFVSVVQKHNAEDQKCSHARKGAGIVRVCSRYEALKLIVPKVPHRDLMRDL